SGIVVFARAAGPDPGRRARKDLMESAADLTDTAVPELPPLPIWDLLVRLRAALRTRETQVKDVLTRNPLESLVGLVVGGAAVYYAAERGRNEKVETFWDALEYVATCASVGYSNIFPTTPAGRMVATVVFLLGPSLSSKALDHPSEEPVGEAA